MKLHIQYLRSLEDSERVRKACLTYMQNWLDHFYPERPDIVAELQSYGGTTSGSSEDAPFAVEIRLDEDRSLDGRPPNRRRWCFRS